MKLHHRNYIFFVALLCLSQSFGDAEPEDDSLNPSVEYESKGAKPTISKLDPSIQKYEYLVDKNHTRHSLKGGDSGRRVKNPSDTDSTESEPESCYCPCLNKRKSSDQQRDVRRKKRRSPEEDFKVDEKSSVEGQQGRR